MYLACVFLTGLAYQRYSIKALALVCSVFIIWEIRSGRKSRKVRMIAGRSILLLSAFFLGIFHMQKEEAFRSAYMSKIIDGSRITVWGECIKTENTEYGIRGFLSDCYIKWDDEVMPCNDILVYTSDDQLSIGRIHKIIGKFNMFQAARNEGNFDSNQYYQSLKIDFSVKAEEIYLLEDAWNLRNALLEVRERVSLVYQTYLSNEAAGFYQAMLLGEKEGLDENLKALFLIGGISHILAISGMHVSILGRGLYQGLRRAGVGFGISGICGGILLFFYCIMAGSSTSTVRAVGMMLCFYQAQWIGRSYDMLNCLGFMAIILLWQNPFLIENTGFWFSITALLGVGLVGSGLAKKEGRLQGIWMSLGITLTTIPVTALSYYEIPLYASLVNFIVLPLLTPIFILAVACGVLGTCLPEFGLLSILLKPCEWLLTFYKWVCKMVSHLPGANLLCGKPQIGQVLLYYTILFIGIYLLAVLRKNETQRKRKAIKFTIIGICVACLFFPKAREAEISFLDVGQGDGIYICAGDGTDCFIDGGSSSVSEVGEYRILPFLKAKGVGEIDYWFISHMDMDHVSGIFEILENGYKIEHIVLSELCSSDDNFKKLELITKEMGTKIIYMKVGDKLCSKNMKITCLGPHIKSDGNYTTDANENSLVLQMEWKRPLQKKAFKALFAGDISCEMEEYLCQTGQLEDVDLFKANHHGSNYSNSTLFLEIIRPEYVVVSCSATNRYGHPGPLAVKRMHACGAEVFYTMDDGQITFPLIQ